VIIIHRIFIPTPVFDIYGIVIYPDPNITALEGVVKGSIKAKDDVDKSPYF